ncbi:hypothetical protein AGLY_013307 [Aphis glycines]|uniref:Uncharacterized protein n=1 Tax=Aphis glycines TaxID=307491 RepID=A0A6G0T823_APHGL|nr:hypothetical protein AGLY_013307 [Aphis glycines]
MNKFQVETTKTTLCPRGNCKKSPHSTNFIPPNGSSRLRTAFAILSIITSKYSPSTIDISSIISILHLRQTCAVDGLDAISIPRSIVHSPLPIPAKECRVTPPIRQADAPVLAVTIVTSGVIIEKDKSVPFELTFLYLDFNGHTLFSKKNIPGGYRQNWFCYVNLYLPVKNILLLELTALTTSCCSSVSDSLRPVTLTKRVFKNSASCATGAFEIIIMTLSVLKWIVALPSPAKRLCTAMSFNAKR